MHASIIENSVWGAPLGAGAQGKQNLNKVTFDRRPSKGLLDDNTAGKRDVLHIFRRSMFWRPERQAPSAWIEHVPFAFWLVDILRPRTVVELGTHFGVSYSAICQAVKSLDLATCCFALDTWNGDEQVGCYAEDGYCNFAAFHDQRYGAFARLVRSTFDEALRHFEDGSIDLLHIDGLHNYEAVRHDYESWLPKLSPDAVILFHDTNVRENNFGVFRLWSEVTRGHLHFYFLHGHGLGVLGLGRNYSSVLRLLFDANEDSRLASSIREIFASLGHSVCLLSERTALDQSLSERNSEVCASRSELVQRDAKVRSLDSTLSARNSELDAIRIALTQRDAKVRSLDSILCARNSELDVIRSELTQREAKVRSLDSTLSARNSELDAIRSELTQRD